MKPDFNPILAEFEQEQNLGKSTIITIQQGKDGNPSEIHVQSPSRSTNLNNQGQQDAKNLTKSSTKIIFKNNPSSNNIFQTDTQESSHTPKNSDTNLLKQQTSIDFNYPQNDIPGVPQNSTNPIEQKYLPQEAEEQPTPTRRKSRRSNSNRSRSGARASSVIKRLTKAGYLLRKNVFDKEKEEELILDPYAFYANHQLKHYEIPKHCKYS